MENLDGINKILEGIKKGVNLDGGDLNLIKMEDGFLHIEFKGRCRRCHSLSNMVTNLEKRIKEDFPHIKGIKLI